MQVHSLTAEGHDYDRDIVNIRLFRKLNWEKEKDSHH